MSRERRIPAREKFWWRGWEFKLSLATATEAHWRLQHGKILIRLIYRDIQDSDAPPEYTAIIRMQGLIEGEGSDPGGDGCASDPLRALQNAELDFRKKLVAAVRLSQEIRRGKPPSES